MLKERRFVPFLSGEKEMAHFDQQKANITFSRALENGQIRSLLRLLTALPMGGRMPMSS